MYMHTTTVHMNVHIPVRSAINCGLSAIYLAASTSYLVPMFFIFARLKSTGFNITRSNGTSIWSSNCFNNCSEYHILNCSFRNFFAGLFTEMSIGCSKSVVLVGNKRTCRLKDHSHLSFKIVHDNYSRRWNISRTETSGLGNVWHAIQVEIQNVDDTL